MSTITEADRFHGVTALAAAGDESAFARIVAAHHEDMVRVAYLVTGDPDIALDAVQSAIQAIWSVDVDGGPPTLLAATTGPIFDVADGRP